MERLHSIISFLGMFLMGLVFTACQKKCQAPAKEAFTSITDTQWRLVETSDPKLHNKINNWNFMIYEFGTSFKCTLYGVIDNEEIEKPLSQCRYKVDAKNNKLYADFFQTNTVSNSSDPSAEKKEEEVSIGSGNYHYKLTGELNLTNALTGVEYRFVPYDKNSAAVKPDDTCEF